MKRIYQTLFEVTGGNCFSACVAMLLGIDLAEVPYFMGDFEEADKGAWFERFAAWLKPHGLYPLNFRCPPDGAWRPQGAYVLSAGSPRGDFAHSVVAHDGEVFHDPHPSRAGLVRLEEQEVTILVPFRPRSDMRGDPR